MTPEEVVCKWMTDKMVQGKTITFMPENNGALMGVWIGKPNESEPALGYGSNTVEAVMHAMSWEEIDRIFDEAKS